jgi:hypothetical protein
MSTASPDVHGIVGPLVTRKKACLQIPGAPWWISEPLTQGNCLVAIRASQRGANAARGRLVHSTGRGSRFGEVSQQVL